MAASDIFERLKQDHDKHRKLIADIYASKPESDERSKLFAQFKTEVTAHAATEEETLYATMMTMTEERHDAQHSVSEHKEIGDLIAEVEKEQPTGTGWAAAFGALADKYTHHIDEEEEEMFPKAAEAIGETKAVELKDEYNQRKPEELERALEGVDEGDERE